MFDSCGGAKGGLDLPLEIGLLLAKNGRNQQENVT
jgi:hypothetical protein